MYRDLESEIAKKEEELRNLQEEREEFSKLGEDKRLASIMHDAMCHSDHTEHCSWGYETWEGTHGEFSPHLQYLKRARAVLKVIPYDKAIAVVRALFGEP